MRKIKLLFFVLIAFQFTSSAQNYFPTGAKWHYEIPAGFSFPLEVSYSTFESIGDSIFNGDTLTHIVGSGGCSPINTILTKQVGNKVMLLNPCDSTFTLFYDFGANAGDTIYMPVDICGSFPDTLTYLIDSINPININGNIRNHYFFTQLNFNTSFYYFGSEIIEGIGCTSFFVPQISVCDPHYGPLRCYNDTVIGEYNTGLHNGVCDTTFFIVGLSENQVVDDVKISPNPTQNKLTITSSFRIKLTELYDVRAVKLISSNNNNIDLSYLPKGIYFVKIYFEEKVVVKKVIKE